MRIAAPLIAAALAALAPPAHAEGPSLRERIEAARAAGRSPESERWYMSTKLEGPDVEGWTMREFEEFALGNPGIGMSEHALLALRGPPTQRLEVPSEAVLIWGTGDEARRYTVRDGLVTDIAAGRY